MAAVMAQPPQDDKGLLNQVPAWGNYLYQNFVLPAFSPNVTTDWLNPVVEPSDYFNAWKDESSPAPAPAPAPMAMPMSAPAPVPEQVQVQAAPAWSVNAIAGPSSYLPYSLPTSFLFNNHNPNHNHLAPQSQATTPSVFGVELDTPPSPKRGAKRRASSIDSESHDDHDPEVPEGVERDGMIWGMKVEDYRALSARERKRVRNRISARTFRAKRKEHLSTLESEGATKDLQIKNAVDEATRLRVEVAELKRRLQRYEPC